MTAGCEQPPHDESNSVSDVYDVLIENTDIDTCRRALEQAKLGSRVLMVDSNSYYGGCDASLTGPQWMKKFEISNSDRIGREYLIDYRPRVYFALGSEVNRLVQDDVAKYLEFCPVDTVKCYIPGSRRWITVPFSRESVAYSKDLSREEKFMLTKCMRRLTSRVTASAFSSDAECTVKSTQVDESDNLFDSGEKFDSTEKFKDMADVVRVLELSRLFSNPHMQVNVQKGTLFLYPLYGVGDVAQAYARRAAVEGVTQVLEFAGSVREFKPNGDVVVRNSEYTFTTRATQGAPPVEEAESTLPTGKLMRRVVIMEAENADKQYSTGASLVVIASTKPVYALFLQSGCGCVPRGMSMITLWSMSDLSAAGPDSQFFDTELSVVVEHIFGPDAERKVLHDQCFVDRACPLNWSGLV